jgi:hypothetical protein
MKKVNTKIALNMAVLSTSIDTKYESVKIVYVRFFYRQFEVGRKALIT